MNQIHKKQSLQLVHYSLIIRSQKLGPSSYKKWWNDKYPAQLGERLFNSGFFNQFVIAEEQGLSENWHLQCYLRCTKRQRQQPLLKKLIELCECEPQYIQLEPANSPRSLPEYCAKTDGPIVRETDYKNSYESSLLKMDLNPYQKEIVKALEECDSRQLVLASDLKGNSGKTWLIKYLIASNAYNTVLWPNSGTLNSSLFTVGKQFEHYRRQNGKITLLLINIVRQDNRIYNDENLSQLMSAVESVLDGLWSSSFQQKLVTINQDPNLIRCLIVTNKSPNDFLHCLSRDRWKIVNKE